MKTLANLLRTFLVEDDGAAAAEYAVMLALIIIVCISAIATFGTKVSSYYVDTEAAMP